MCECEAEGRYALCICKQRSEMRGRVVEILHGAELAGLLELRAPRGVVRENAFEEFGAPRGDEAEEEVHAAEFVGEVDVLFETEEDDFFDHPEFLVVDPCGERKVHDLRGDAEF